LSDTNHIHQNERGDLITFIPALKQFDWSILKAACPGRGMRYKPLQVALYRARFSGHKFVVHAACSARPCRLWRTRRLQNHYAASWRVCDMPHDDGVPNSGRH